MHSLLTKIGKVSFRGQRWLRLRVYVFLLCLSFLLPLGVNGQTLPSPSPVVTASPEFPERQVVLAGESLFTLHEQLGSITPEERAKIISQRLKKVAEDPLVKLDSLTLRNRENVTDLFAGQQLILSITDTDAQTVKRSRSEYAADIRRKVQEAISQYRERFGSGYWVIIGIYGGIATLCGLIFLLLLQYLYPKLFNKIISYKGTRIRSLKIQQFELLSEDQIAATLVTLVGWTKKPLIFFSIYLYVWFLLSLLPWTSSISEGLGATLLSMFSQVGQAIWLYIPNLVFILIIFGISYYIVQFFRMILSAIERGLIGFSGFYQEWAQPTFQIGRFLIFAFALALIVPYLPGAGSPAVQGMSIFLGLLVSLGSTVLVANIVAGLALTYTRAFQVGDRIQIGDTVGDVIEKTFLATRIKTIKNVVVTIPNSMLLSAQIINYSSAKEESGLILHTSVGIGYDVPWEMVHQLLIAAAQETHLILREPAPFILQSKLDDYAVVYELNAHTKFPEKMALIYSELHQHIQTKFNEAEIEIMSPAYTALRDGRMTTVPSVVGSNPAAVPPFQVIVTDSSDESMTKPKPS